MAALAWRGVAWLTVRNWWALAAAAC